MLSPPEPIDLMKKWTPEMLIQYCRDNELADLSEQQAYEIVQQFPLCPIKEFQNAGISEQTIICILRNECERLFKSKKLSKSIFAPICQIAFEREDPFELPILPEIFGENEFCELFNEVLVHFLD